MIHVVQFTFQYFFVSNEVGSASLQSVLIGPLIAMKRLNALVNASVTMVGATSRWIALEYRQVNSASHRGTSLLLILTKNGPK